MSQNGTHIVGDAIPHPAALGYDRWRVLEQIAQEGFYSRVSPNSFRTRIQTLDRFSLSFYSLLCIMTPLRVVLRMGNGPEKLSNKILPGENTAELCLYEMLQLPAWGMAWSESTIGSNRYSWAGYGSHSD